jgi:hypothetical protein
MTATHDNLRHDLLDLLVDGPSSFAAVYGALVRHCGYPSNLSVNKCFDALSEMERREWVTIRLMEPGGSFSPPSDIERARSEAAYQQWLPKAGRSDLSLDEVGLWWWIQEKGRREWEKWSASDDAPDAWAIDEYTEDQRLVVSASDVQVAEEALRNWLSLDPAMQLVAGSRSVEPLPTATLRNGITISNGVRLHYRYQRIQGKPSDAFK